MPSMPSRERAAGALFEFCDSEAVVFDSVLRLFWLEECRLSSSISFSWMMLRCLSSVLALVAKAPLQFFLIWDSVNLSCYYGFNSSKPSSSKQGPLSSSPLSFAFRLLRLEYISSYLIMSMWLYPSSAVPSIVASSSVSSSSVPSSVSDTMALDGPDLVHLRITTLIL